MIALEFESVRAPLEEVVAWMVENVRIRDGFAELAERHRPLIVSSGFHELIEPILEREGLQLDVVANRIEARPDGWRARFRNADPCAVCGQPCKRADVAGLGEFAYAGDGFSDRCVALRRLASSPATAWPTTSRRAASRSSPSTDFHD